MAYVTIDSGPVDANYLLREVAQKDWGELMRARRTFIAINLPHDCRCLLQFADDAEAMAKPLGFVDATDFIKRGLELDPQQVQWAIDGLQRLKPNEPITYKRAQEIGKLDAQDRANQRPRGRRSKAVQQENECTGFPSGNSRAAFLRRLRKDRPDIHARVLAGELSPHAGMIEAGFRKKRQPMKLSALERIRKLLPSLTSAERNELRALLDASDIASLES